MAGQVSIRLLSDGGGGEPLVPVPANSTEPVCIKGRHFAGRVLWVAAGAKWATQIQVQGRFKKPVRDLWARAEIDSLPELGWFGRGIAHTLFGLCSHASGGRFVYHFGDADQKPYFAFPLALVTTMVATEAGAEPPALGSAELEAAEYQGCEAAALDTEQTYTFLFQSSFIDVANWMLLRVPGVGGLNLESLTGSFDTVRLVGYDATDPDPYPQNGESVLFAWHLKNASAVTPATEVKLPCGDPLPSAVLESAVGA